MSQMRMSIMQPTPNAKGRKQPEEDNFMTLVNISTLPSYSSLADLLLSPIAK